jgi:hypothetical protein
VASFTDLLFPAAYHLPVTCLPTCLPACLALLARDLRRDELEELVEKVNSKRRSGTRNKYGANQKVWMVSFGV